MLFIHFKSLFSFRFYHRLAQLRPLYAVGFAVYLFFLCNIVLFFFTGSVLKKNLPVFLKNFPQVTFEKGVLTAPQNSVFAPIPNTDFKIVFDASAQTPPSNDTLLNNHTLAWVHKNQIYIPSASGLQIQTLPENISFTSDPQTVEKYKDTLSVSLRMALFVTSLFMVVLLFAFDYCLALSVLFFFNIYKRALLPKRTLLKMAAFLLGPLSTLFLVRLWINIPLFMMAQLILCIIYTQQIFNTLPEDRSHEN